MTLSRSTRGDVAQLVEHLLCKQGVRGSNPRISTKNWPFHSLGERAAMGLRHWVRNRHELLLIGRRGKLPTPIKIPCSVLETQQDSHARKHSEKPEEIYAVIDGMHPGVNMRRLELFSRNLRESWTSRGAECGKKRALPKCSPRATELLPCIRTRHQIRSG
jgi:MT-A70